MQGYIPLSTILPIVDFAENYILQPQNETRSQYSFILGSTKVHMTYRHGPDSSEDRKRILKEFPLLQSDYRCHDLHYVQLYFKMFYDHLKDREIHMDLHCIW